MSTFKPYFSAIEAPSLAEVQALPGLTLLEFGTEWCGHCRAAQPLIAQALTTQMQMQTQTPCLHLKIEDGPGRALGRTIASSSGPRWWFCAMGRRWGVWCGLQPLRTLKPWFLRHDGVETHQIRVF